MPFVATSLEQAISFTNERVGIGAPLGLVTGYATTFNDLWSAAFDPDKEGDRTVRNWLVQARSVQSVDTTTGDAANKQTIVNVTCRIMFATLSAVAVSRITVAQRNAVLSAWNASFGAAP